MIEFKIINVKFDADGRPNVVDGTPTPFIGEVNQGDNLVTRIILDLSDIPGNFMTVGLDVVKEDGSRNTERIVCYPVQGQIKKYAVDISRWYTTHPGDLELNFVVMANYNGLTQELYLDTCNIWVNGNCIDDIDDTVIPETFYVLSVNGYAGVIDITHENIGDEPDAEVAVPDEENNTNFKFRTFKAGPHIVITQCEDHIKISLADDIPTNDEVDGALSALNNALTEALSTHAGNDNAHNLASLRSTVSGLVTAVGNLQTVVGSGGADADVIINKLAEVYTFLADFEENDDLLAMINSKLEEVVVEGGEEEEGKYVSAVKRDEYDPNKIVVEKKTLPSVPTKVSELENDEDFVKESDLVDKITEAKELIGYLTEDDIPEPFDDTDIQERLGDIEDIIKSIDGENDADTVINKLHEIVALLNGYAEGTTLANLLSGKSDTNHNHDSVYVKQVEGKTLTDNNLTNTLKSNYDTAYTHSQTDHAPSNAQANIIETVKVNGVALPVSSKAVDITIPETDLSNYYTKTEIDNMIGDIETLLEGI